ncbi:MAG: amidophosphoribosyltransferase [Spirochaetota bacterium]
MLYTGVNNAPCISSLDSIYHKCGIVGIFSQKKENIPEKLFYSLFSLQHRGQESSGIAYKKGNEIVVYKDLGMVSTVLSRYLSENKPSNVGIGHVRYSTHGGTTLENAQPFVVTCNKGEIALAHNGNISNSLILKKRLFEEGSIFQSTSDTELILHFISRSKKRDFRAALVETLLKLEGAYSMVMIHNDSLLAMRDPLGFRPLYIGNTNDMIVITSETCALDILEVSDYRSVLPGELIIIDGEGIKSERFAENNRSKSQCIFELIYFARPDSYVFDTSVYMTRKKIGTALAECETHRGDIVVPVPDSGNSAALGYAEASGLPFELALTRNHYAGRSFIMPTTAQRTLAVRMKLHPVRDAIRGKRIFLIDDSLVRGTTSGILVKLIKDAGAREVHLRLSSPEIQWPCYFGIDIPTRQELVSNSMTPPEIARHIGADSVMFIPLDKLKSCVELPSDYCFACFSGDYPLPV